jgi:capsular exopolysaccharide synthesis family protein
VPQDSDELNIARALGFIRRRGIWIVLCVVVAAGAALGYSKHQIKKYTATVSLSFSSSQLSQEIAGVPTGSSSLSVQQASNLELLHLGDLAQKTAVALGHGLSAAKVNASLSISGQPESTVAEIASTLASPRLAAEIANTYSQQFVLEQAGKNHRYYQSALTLVRRQLAALSPRQRIGNDGLELQDRAQSLELLAGLEPNTVQIAQEASVPTAPSSPRTKRNILIGGILGLFVGLGLALLLERIDPRIREPKELEAIYQLPLLGVVPQSAAVARFEPGDDGTPPALPLAEAEAFHMVRARLRAFHAGRQLCTVMVASAGPGEGKSTIARHLAGAGVRMGSRVLLMEADLRQPKLAQRLGLHSRVGLPDVLNGTISMAAATQSIRLDAEAAGTLDVLPSGPSVPPNPVELIESDAMEAFLAQAKSAYDLVVVDAPELTSISDAFLMLSKVDGVIIVGRMGRSRRDVARRLTRVLASSGAPLVGIVANGVKPGRRGFDNPAANFPKSVPAANMSGASTSEGDQLVPSTRA